jgi:integrase/recombinase XerD
MISLKITLDTRRAKKGGSFPIVFRISANGTSRNISTGFESSEADWNYRTSNLKETHKSFSVVQRILKEKELEYLGKIMEYQKDPTNELHPQKIKEYLSEKKIISESVYDFWQEEVDHLHKIGRNGGAIVYKQSLAAINNVKPLNIPFEKVNYVFLRELEADFVAKGLNLNSIGIHFRALRAIYNKAIDSGKVSLEYYPFKKFKIRKQKTVPRVLSMKEIQLYFSFDASQNPTLYEHWLIGKLMFLLIGINLKDLILLKPSNLKSGRIIYNRAKTKKQYSINLLPEVQSIIDYFLAKGGVTILNYLREEELNNTRRLPLKIHQKNKILNKYLGRIGSMLGFKEKLTGYVFRYTWANIAKQLGYSKDLIAEALGHQYGNKVTGIYLEAYDTEVIDEMNQQICFKVVERSFKTSH